MTLIPRSIKRWLGVHSRIRGCAFYIGLLSSITILVIWGVSEYRCVRYWSVRGKLTTLCPGAIEWQYESLAILCGPYGFSVFEASPNSSNRRWSLNRRSVPSGYHFSIPLWMFLFPCVAAWLIAWPARDSRLNRCNQCEYDLTSNESGVCPECGKRVHTDV